MRIILLPNIPLRLCSFFMLNRIEGTSSPTTTEARLLSTLPPSEHRGPILRRVVKMKLWNDVTCDNDVDLEDLAVNLLVNLR